MSRKFEILNTKTKSANVVKFEDALAARIIGQDAAVAGVSDIFQVYLSGLAAPGRPLGTLLFLGPTGTGKTKTVESACDVIYGNPNAMIKIDCAEFQHSHEIAKLIGSPPGYLGHRETSPMLTQENLDRCHTDKNKVSFVLFDEIEKASDSLWNLLLGILDKAVLTLGDNRKVNFSNAIIVMTSNLGAREMQEMVSTKLGFVQTKPKEENVDVRMKQVALEAARRKFSPEFMNRIDKVVVFQTLSNKAVEQILDLELKAVQDRITEKSSVKMILSFTQKTKKFLLEEGFDQRYNARPLKRSVEKWVVLPLANLVSSEQLNSGDEVVVDLHPNKSELRFKRVRKPAAKQTDLEAGSELLNELINAIEKPCLSLVKAS